MKPGQQPNICKIKWAVAGYNAVANVVWSVLNLTPAFIFCYRFVPATLLLIFLATSLLTAFLPNSFFYRMQLSKTKNIYQKLGVGFVNKFTQNGEIINKLIRRRFPEYKVVSTGKRSVKKALGQTFMFEKFHFILFMLFSCLTVYASLKNYYLWAFILLITNLLYNIYPCLLQQYIRLRLLAAVKRHHLV
ncbi:hypothetical protein [Adhaeribacter aerolatus]|uniref:glycosyl-4,4'-diaponeurosporenoate acyltransferase CrtO family protein n=1 Tax=Adhaeribacter aerolatus TaxID=670289 RepID=UPI0011BEB347|nr:hypothetical protein [Adhaeribacter aerolatus]